MWGPGFRRRSLSRRGPTRRSATTLQATMAQYTEIIYEVKNAVAFITLNRPDKRNALNDQIIAEMRGAMVEAEADDQTRVVILRGAGKDFCAGADLAQLEKSAQASVLENLEGASRMADLFLTMRGLKKPV